jgi:hypothetical protein
MLDGCYSHIVWGSEGQPNEAIKRVPASNSSGLTRRNAEHHKLQTPWREPIRVALEKATPVNTPESPATGPFLPANLKLAEVSCALSTLTQRWVVSLWRLGASFPGSRRLFWPSP